MAARFSAYNARDDKAAEWSPTSVFDETDGAVASDVIGGQIFGMKHIGARSEIVEVLMDRGEPRRAGIGLVGRLFNRKYRKSRASRLEAQMANIDMHR